MALHRATLLSQAITLMWLGEITANRDEYRKITVNGLPHTHRDLHNIDGKKSQCE